MTLLTSCGKENQPIEEQPIISPINENTNLQITLPGQWSIPEYGTIKLPQEIKISSDDFDRLNEIKIEYKDINDQFDFTCYYSSHSEVSDSAYILQGCENAYSILDFNALEPIAIEQGNQIHVNLVDEKIDIKNPVIIPLIYEEL